MAETVESKRENDTPGWDKVNSRLSAGLCLLMQQNNVHVFIFESQCLMDLWMLNSQNVWEQNQYILKIIV